MLVCESNLAWKQRSVRNNNRGENSTESLWHGDFDQTSTDMATVSYTRVVVKRGILKYGPIRVYLQEICVNVE